MRQLQATGQKWHLPSNNTPNLCSVGMPIPAAVTPTSKHLESFVMELPTVRVWRCRLREHAILLPTH